MYHLCMFKKGISFNLRMTRFLIATGNESTSCEGLLSEKECVEALKDIDPENAPGTDSFPAALYKIFGTNKHLV